MKHMISDPLALAIISMIVGMCLGVVCSILGMMISRDIHKDDPGYPSSEDMDQLCLWYEAEYEQRGVHEK